MKREHIISQIQSNELWDVVIIGGGASGLGAAIESAARGYKTMLLEQYDFTKGTSSRSTKLVHGGVRYLAQGNIALVLEALKERGLMRKNAPHLVSNLSFLIPSYSWWTIPFFTIGLTIYDLLAGKLSFGSSKPQKKSTTISKIPTIRTKHLRGGVLYHDGQFDDSRLGINMVQTIQEQGGTALNYMKVIEPIKTESELPQGKPRGSSSMGYRPAGKITGVVAQDGETGIKYAINAKVVVNATGVFVDKILQKDNPKAKDIVQPSQGVHLVVDKAFLPTKYALMIPKTPDGRVLFAVPWHDKVVLGTTDLPVKNAEIEPMATDEEVDFILETAGRYLTKKPTRNDVKSVFAGLRPLAASDDEGGKTKEISRGHKIYESASGMITVVGGKWTTYRQMGEEVIDKASQIGVLPKVKSITQGLHIHGYTENIDDNDPLKFYGSDSVKIKNMMDAEPELKELISKSLNITAAQVAWAFRHEMARNVEDVLARRTRALFLDAAESIRMAPAVAKILSKENNYDKAWEEAQITEFTQLAKKYLIAER